MKSNITIAILTSTFLTVGTAHSQDPMPLEQRQKIAELEKGIAAADYLKVAVDEMSRVRNNQCLQAFGHTKFCGCLTKNLPVALSFKQYIYITTQTKAENHYFALNRENKKVYDMTENVRDQCVKQM